MLLLIVLDIILYTNQSFSLPFIFCSYDRYPIVTFFGRGRTLFLLGSSVRFAFLIAVDMLTVILKLAV